MTTEGLFRVPGPAQQIEDLKKSFEEGRDPLAYSAVRNIEITGVASVLKLYFRELVSPLFPCEMYYDFIKCTSKLSSDCWPLMCCNVIRKGRHSRETGLY